MKLTEYQLKKILELATIEYRLFYHKSDNIEEKTEYYEKCCIFDYFFTITVESILGFDYPAAAEILSGTDGGPKPTIESIKDFFENVKPTPPMQDFLKNKKNFHDMLYRRNFSAYSGHKDTKKDIMKILDCTNF